MVGLGLGGSPQEDVASELLKRAVIVGPGEVIGVLLHLGSQEVHDARSDASVDAIPARHEAPLNNGVLHVKHPAGCTGGVHHLRSVMLMVKAQTEIPAVIVRTGAKRVQPREHSTFRIRKGQDNNLNVIRILNYN